MDSWASLQTPGADLSSYATTVYVDAAVAGIAYKTVKLVATTLAAFTQVGNVLTANANGALTVDSVAVVAGDRVLYAPSAGAASAGVYTVTTAGTAGTAFVLTRATDSDSAAEIPAGCFVVVTAGTVYGDTIWELQTDGAITLNTTSLTFAQVASPGTGITRTGNVYSIDTSVVVDKTTAQTLTNKTLTSPAINTPTGIVKGDVGLGSVDNTSDATKNAAAVTLTNKRITKRVQALADAATVTPDADSYDVWSVAELSQITTIAAPSGTPTDGQFFVMRLKSTTSRALTWNAIYRDDGTLTKPTATVATKYIYLCWCYNSAATKYDLVGARTAGF